MRKLLTFILTLVMICSLAVPAMAANEAVVYTSDSSFVAGGTVKVNKLKTQQNIMDLGKNAAEYNAALEGNMQYYWFRNDSYYKDGPSITLTENDKGCQFYCKVYLFSDADRTQQCGTYDGAKFTVPNTGNPALIPEIRDAAIPDGKVGQSYYVKLDCSDPDVVFSLFRSSLPDGLTLTQHGEIEGTPTKEGFWHVVIMVTPEAGADYANTKEFEITIEAGEEYTLEIMEVPDKVDYTVGEKLDMKGMWVRIYTSEGFIDSRDGKDLTYTQNPLTNVGERKIKISYKDAFTFFYVNVKEAPKHEHKDNLTKVVAKTATCTVDGNIEYYTCSCGKWFSDATATVEITNKASVVIKAGHEYGTLVEEVPAKHTATELKAGMKAHYFCDKCDTYFTAEKVATTESELVIPAPVHEYNTVNGYREADGHADTCSCSAHNTVAPHTPDREAATETDPIKCSVCGYEIAPALGHIHKNNLTKVPAETADCEKDGNIEYYTCSCGKYFKDASAASEITDLNSVVIKAAHKFGTEWDYKGEDGHAHVCSCGTKDEILAHTPNVTAPTETEDQVCTTCGYVIASKTGPVDPPVTDPATPPTTGDATTEPSQGGADNKEDTKPDTTPSEKDDEQKQEGMPWWGILLIAVAAAGIGVAVTILVLKKKK